jgi:hypothetical protein
MNTAVLNYSLNRFCPILLLGALILSNFSLTDWQVYVTIALMIFMDKYQFKVGYSVGYCEAAGIDPMKDASIPPKKNKK